MEPEVVADDMNEGVESDMDCDSGTESELEVVNLSEPADSVPATHIMPRESIDHRPTAIVKAISFFLFFFS